MTRLSARGVGAVALASAIVLGVAGVSFGKALFDRFTPQEPPAATTGQPSAEDRVALQALAATPAVATEADRNDALRINASLPFSSAPIEAARPFTAPRWRPDGPAYSAAVPFVASARPCANSGKVSSSGATSGRM